VCVYVCVLVCGCVLCGLHGPERGRKTHQGDLDEATAALRDEGISATAAREIVRSVSIPSPLAVPAS
jgi:hypothetical protein